MYDAVKVGDLNLKLTSVFSIKPWFNLLAIEWGLTFDLFDFLFNSTASPANEVFIHYLSQIPQLLSHIEFLDSVNEWNIQFILWDHFTGHFTYWRHISICFR